MTEKGCVVSLKDGKAKVEIIRNEMCRKCHACDMGSNNRMMIEVDAIDELKVGDNVLIEVKDISMLKATLIMYGIPLLFFFVGVFAGYAVAHIFGIDNFSQMIEAISGLLFTAISFIGIKYYSKKVINKEYKPVIKKI
ncbi:SoxR reducing system RseC family protein [Thermoanaerobacterium thermosaccharolyticum]|jgi:sigma-E factor negative regulatory protein RseC|uniref:SoxR reducing system RseC family protein n=1 Tax=Thermoanaerobacterium thermosaccharolyticum TaxID=1517 RepID=UPI001238EA8D|nr:SoxR reducing system RseC family protein [Thermoanaerobacterium thermosaccharolyticum]KAA5808279.1 SoxR reducing system RseC family protein [Thermoanaerobacterium thermosaccharolyticum]